MNLFYEVITHLNMISAWDCLNNQILQHANLIGVKFIIKSCTSEKICKFRTVIYLLRFIIYCHLSFQFITGDHVNRFRLRLHTNKLIKRKLVYIIFILLDIEHNRQPLAALSCLSTLISKAYISCFL